MDVAVAIVQAYLRVNGYFTVSEYPVIEAMGGRNYRIVTDIDILAVRFPGAGRMISGTPSKRKRKVEIFEPDPHLRSRPDGIDMIIGEVKEGRAELNRATRDPIVLGNVLTRFGCCPAESSKSTVEKLMQEGHTELPNGHRVRLIAFGSTSDGPNNGYEVIELSHIIHFLRKYFRDHWDVLRHAQFKDPALGFLMTLEKAL